MDNFASRRAVIGIAGLTGAAGALAGRSSGQSPRASTGAPPCGVDPRNFGAKADGVTDDSAALAAAAATGRAVLIEGQLRIEQVVDLPADAALLGAGVRRSTVTLGARGKLRMAGTAFDRRGGGGTIRDLTIRPVDRANAEPGLELRHVEHMVFDNVTFARLGMVLDDHHFLSFRDCRFTGDQDRTAVVSNCDSQPGGWNAISEVPRFTGCFFSFCPVLMQDTVDAHFTDCTFLNGPSGIRSIRRLSRGTEARPFFMGPLVSGCVFDYLDGPAIEIEGGGTDCRIIGSFISCGRVDQKPGVQLTGCSAVELVGNRFEWCGSTGLALESCERIGVVGNSFGNQAAGPAILARGSREVRVVGNAFENRSRWGGSTEGHTTLAIDADAACTGWVVTANTAFGLRDPRVSTLTDGLVEGNGGWPPATERGWPSGPSEARPRGVADGYRWYDQSLGRWLHWHRASGRWRDPSGTAV